MGKGRIYDIAGKIYRQCSGSRSYDCMQQLARYHRVQASQGYRKAAVEAEKLLKEAGTQTQICTYPADLQKKCFTQLMFREWNCTEAWLDVTFPWTERAACFSLEEMTLIQRSAEADYSDRDLPVIYVPDTVSPESFEMDLTDKVLFVENGFARWTQKLQESHAAALITVSMPEISPVRVRMSEDSRMKEAHANLSFTHYTKEQEASLRGFVVSPRLGKQLREACLELEKQGSCPTVRFKIDSEFKDGSIENVMAVIPGETKEEILLTAHLCHPRSSVNDNASGAACAVEAINVLQTMIQNGELPKPKRTIKMLLIPEFTGTYAYLAEQEERLSEIKAGFNMDMVAGRQDGTAGPLIIVDTPDCAHSFSGDLSEAILDVLSGECAFGGNKIFVPLFSGMRVPFVFGSDHYILSDPTVDIPAVALTQWPDKNYHTSVDDAAHVDPDMLRRAAAMAASYCYLYASMTVETVKELLPYTVRRFFARADEADRNGDLRKTEHLRRVIADTLDRYASLFEGEERTEAEHLLAEEKKRYERLFGGCEKEKNSPASEGRKPKRLFKGPAVMRCVLNEMTEEQKRRYTELCCEYPEVSENLDYIFYETDGKSTLEEIAERVFCQTDVDCLGFLPAFFDLFRDLGLTEG